MDSWGFASNGKGQIGPMNGEFTAPFIFGNNMGLFPNEVNIDHQVFVEMGLRNSLFNPVMAATQNACSGDNQSSSKLESNCTDSGLVDLKLCKIIHQKEAQIINSSKIAHHSSPSELSTPSKRPRVGSFGSLAPFCLVDGCNKSLSSCKDYHKRHKVCEVHSKTSKVIVNGIEQRFCQQCSRFHLLGEFDDGKRSCRKRLAGHNERRRKPHVGVLSGRHDRLLPSYNIRVEGNEFKGSTGAISSFQLPNALCSPRQQKRELNGWWQMNEDQTPQDLQSISSITDEELPPQPLSPSNFNKNPRFNRIINTYIQAPNSALSFMPSRMASNSGSALSLLSFQSQSTSCSNSHSNPHPFLFSGSHYEPTQDPQVNPMLGSEGSLVNFGVENMLRESKHVNSEDGVFPDEGRTIDLLQLSSQLERVEHQKQILHVNLANGVSVGLGIT